MPRVKHDAIWRIVDANLNRAREGLRVCEDLVRFILNDSRLMAALKSCRHELNQISLEADRHSHKLLASRSSTRDVGKRSWVRDQRKIGHKSLLAANLKRAEEGLRVLEECAKIVSPKSVGRFQALRFRVYELEKKLLGKF